MGILRVGGGWLWLVESGLCESACAALARGCREDNF